MDSIEIPRCHYCGRLAPELHYKNISVCVECMDRMEPAWYVYRRPDGIGIISSEPPDKLPRWELIEAGRFSELWGHYYTELGEG